MTQSICTVHVNLNDDDDTYTSQVGKALNQKANYEKKCLLCLDDEDKLEIGFCVHHGAISPELIKIHNGREVCRICHRASSGKKRNSNRADFNARMAKDREENPEKWAKMYKAHYARLKARFGDYHSLNKQCRLRGITLDKYAEMLDKQDNKCAICLQEETCKDPKHDKIRRLSIDHCHKTGKARELLCQGCNVAIGRFKDDIELMERAINYVKKHYG